MHALTARQQLRIMHYAIASSSPLYHGCGVTHNTIKIEIEIETTRIQACYRVVSALAYVGDVYYDASFGNCFAVSPCCTIVLGVSGVFGFSGCGPERGTLREVAKVEVHVGDGAGDSFRGC